MELYNFVVKREYPHIADLAAKVILLEATDKLLAYLQGDAFLQTRPFHAAASLPQGLQMNPK